MELTKEKLKKLNSISLYKVTNFNNCHRTYHYVDGLNVASDSFGDDPVDDTALGFYFVCAELLGYYYNYGIKIRKLKLPIDDPDLKVIRSNEKHKYYANKIILDPRSDCDEIWTYSDLEQLGKNLDKNTVRKYISYATNYNDFEILNWWKNSGIDVDYPIHDINRATENGNIAALNWWLDNYLDKIYCERIAIDNACYRGKIESLNWWFDVCIKYGIQFEYTHKSVDNASRNGNVEILEWWFSKYIDVGLEFKYTMSAISDASHYRQFDALNWWLNKKHTYGIEIECSIECSIDHALAHGQLDVLKWWKASGLKIIHSNWALSCALLNDHTNVLDWWNQSGMPLKLAYCIVGRNECWTRDVIGRKVDALEKLGKVNNYVIQNYRRNNDLNLLL